MNDPDIKPKQVRSASIQCSLCQSVSEPVQFQLQRGLPAARIWAKGTSRPLHLTNTQPISFIRKNMCQTISHHQQSEPKLTNQSTSIQHTCLLWILDGQYRSFLETGFSVCLQRTFHWQAFHAGATGIFSDHGDHHDLLSHHPIHF